LPRAHLAVIIPAYNEQDRIGPTLERVCEYFQGQNYTWHVTVVSDGSSDETPKIAADFAAENPNVSVDHYEPNRGKGYAVQRGMMKADADWILFSDADLAAPIEEIDKLFKRTGEDRPIAIGSRPLKDSNLEIRQPWYREMLGRAFNTAVQILAIRGIKDTQCGFKIFRQAEAQEIFKRCKLDGFGFDFESLMIARDLDIPIEEVPIRWSHQEGSKVILMRDGPRMLRDLIKLRLWGKKRRLTTRESD
jgi:dolichyl-phosphate beta-glucosyltransferase